jgi:cyanophycinase-like exopeptidase
MKQLLAIFIITSLEVTGQSFNSYFIGNELDVTVTSLGGICLMGGAAEDDNAMKWFLERANGGDVLVIRTSGSDGYNNYLYNDLATEVNSVETIVFNTPLGSNSSYIHEKIQKAEAIWIAGGDQWDYVNYWRGTPVDSLINIAISERNITIGGTSAGMAVLGGAYFSAQNGTVTSQTALNNPFDQNITIDNTSFFNLPILSNVITDTHYDDPDRKGRHAVFMARMQENASETVRGIACDEYTAVCIDETGIASVFGDYPSYNDFAYFLQVNCEHLENTPEVLEENTPLTWYINNEAIKVFKVPGKTNGSGYLNLNNWSEGVGGSWLNWSIEDGVLNTEGCPPISCNTESVEETDLVNVKPELITDVMGRKVFAKKNTLLFFHYKNGEIRKRFITKD